MSIAGRPQLVEVIPVTDLARVVEMVNSNFRRYRELFYNIDTALDEALDALTKRVKALEAAGAAPSTTTTIIGAPAGGGAVIPIPEITPNTVTVALAGASVTAASVAPNDSLLFAIYITINNMTGATSLDAGITNHVDKFGRGLTTTGDITTFTFINPGYVILADLDVLLTARGGNFTGGTADITSYYWRRP